MNGKMKKVMKRGFLYSSLLGLALLCLVLAAGPAMALPLPIAQFDNGSMLISFNNTKTSIWKAGKSSTSDAATIFNLPDDDFNGAAIPLPDLSGWKYDTTTGVLSLGSVSGIGFNFGDGAITGTMSGGIVSDPDTDNLLRFTLSDVTVTQGNSTYLQQLANVIGTGEAVHLTAFLSVIDDPALRGTSTIRVAYNGFISTPEPSTMLFFGVGLVCLAGTMRKADRKKRPRC